MRIKNHPLNQIGFLCPGCDMEHTVSVADNGWQFNHDNERPTLSPSIKVTSGHYLSNHKEGDACWCGTRDAAFSCGICHSFVREGRIEFLSDCTHKLAGQTVDLIEYA